MLTMLTRMMKMLTDKQLKDKWDNLPYQSKSHIRVDAGHLLDWHIGYENLNQKSLLLISKVKPPEVESSKSILFSVGERNNGDWALSLKLIREEQEDVYIRLCLDLIESSRICNNDSAGINFVLNRYNQWAKLMENKNSYLLTASQQKGLLGELQFLEGKINEKRGLQEIVSSWMGPEGADQDFVFSEKWYEIKSIAVSSHSVSISSLEQLDAPLPGELIVNLVDSTSPEDPNGITLRRKVMDIKEALASDINAQNLFEKKLLKVGYIDIPEYDKISYRCVAIKKFNVDNKFPRITRQEIPSEIESLEYKISIPAIKSWEID